MMQGDMLKVLMVDDEPYILQGLSVIVDWTKEGYEIVAMKNSGIQAIEELEKQEVDLIITDIKMPQMTGLELAKKVREEKLSDASVVILSGYHDFSYATQAIKCECVDYLLKPINKDELLAVLQKVRSRRLKNRELELRDWGMDNHRAQEASSETEAEEQRDGEEFQPLKSCQVQGILSELEEYLRENYMQNLTLKEMGKKYFVNSVYLGQIFKKQYGESFKDYLNRIRMEKAKELLKNTDKKIYEIAEEIGYKDIDYFVNKFITTNGCTPTKYRKNVR